MPDRIAQAVRRLARLGQVHHDIRGALRGRLRHPDGSRRRARSRASHSTRAGCRCCSSSASSHAFVLWWGDILVTYAICGLFLLLFRNLSQRAILVWAHALYWFIVVLSPASTSRRSSTRMTIRTGRPQAAGDHRHLRPRHVRQIFALSGQASGWKVNSFIFFLTRILGIFLFGLWIWRQGYLRAAGPCIWPGGSARSASGCHSAFSSNLARGRGSTWVFHPNPMRPTLLMIVIFAAAVARDCRR